MKTLKIFLAGVVVGLLFAPNTGAETREKVSKLFMDYKDDAKDYVADVADKVESKVESAKKAIKEI